jgi:hypothetical protein
MVERIHEILRPLGTATTGYNGQSPQADIIVITRCEQTRVLEGKVDRVCYELTKLGIDCKKEIRRDQGPLRYKKQTGITAATLEPTA